MADIKRDSFIIYRSYWEGLKMMSKEVQCEVYNAIMEYGFTGNIPRMGDVAKGIFILMKPNIDISLARYSNGRKGGKASAQKRVVTKTQMTFDQEVDEMRSNKQWGEPVCMQFCISEQEMLRRLDEFSTHIKCTMDGVGHESIGDAHRHFMSWMKKKFANTAPQEEVLPDYTYDGGFGSLDN